MIRELTTTARGSRADDAKADVYTVRVDLETQILRLQVPEDIDVVHDWGDDDRWVVTQSATIHPRLSDVPRSGLCSASVLAQKAKQFDDGLYAAVELAVEEGGARFDWKRELIDALARRLDETLPAKGENVAAVLLAARHLGLHSVPDELWSGSPHRADAERLLEKFLATDWRSKPLGFYTWSAALSDVFRQDRMLQSELEGREQIATLAHALSESSDLGRAYAGYLAFVSRLTNPPAPELLPVPSGIDGPTPAGRICLFPPSRSSEGELAKRLFGDLPISEGFDLLEELIRRVQQGELDLAPSEASGWYDHQVHALEPLLKPESTREARCLQLATSYRAHLVDLFRGLMALTRETHVKQIEIPTRALRRPAPRIAVSPELSVEPLATYYLRRAASYRFVRALLEETFGSKGLRGARRLTADGPVGPSLGDELDQMEALFYGAHAVACAELGLEPEAGPPGRSPRTDAERFRAWQGAMSEDVDLGVDARMMVPVFYDIERQKVKAWAFLGWSGRPLELSFAEPPRIEMLDERGRLLPKGDVEVGLESCQRQVAYPVMAEVYVDRLLDRAEFRAHCDRFRTQEEIIARLCPSG